MAFFKDLSIERKLTLATLVTFAVAMLIVTATVLAGHAVIFHRDMDRDLSVLSKTLADKCASALASDDPKRASEILSTLKAQPRVVGATIVHLNGVEFVRFGNATNSPETGAAMLGPIQFVRGYPVIREPIMLARKRIGTLKLGADYSSEFLALLRLDAEILGLALAVSLAVAAKVSRRAHRIVSNPILQLVNTARAADEKNDFSIRAEVRGQDEIGELGGVLNRLLGRIESHDLELRRINRKMEEETITRKSAESALLESRKRYEVAAVAMLGSSDGLWDWDLVTDEVVFSPQWKNMLGYKDHEVANASEAWRELLHPEDRERALKGVDDYLTGRSPAYEIEYRLRKKAGDYLWILSRGAALRDASGKPFRFAGAHTDITARKVAEAGLEQLHRQMIETSRFAGMAEVATGVLHNVGNVLNSVNVSATLVCDRLEHSNLTDLAKAAALFKEHTNDLPAFLTSDPKGRVLPGYLRAGLEQARTEQAEMRKELRSLQQNIEHIKQVVAMQQTYARPAGVAETLMAEELVEAALHINTATFQSHPVQVIRQFRPVPPVTADRHKAVQILINVLSNARHAMDNVTPEERRLEIIIDASDRGGVTIAVRDNGMGISEDNLARIFRHGFTTRKDGHGFGLHSSANAATEIGGSLAAHSDGPGKGATFTLELPVADEPAAIEATQPI
jgi:PAS domain S-box-containing protein